jgi:hypothetical protein
VEKNEKQVGKKKGVLTTCYTNKKILRECIFTKSNQMLKEEMAQCNMCRTTKIIKRTCGTNEEA